MDGSVWDTLFILKDFRVEGRCEHTLHDIMALSICAVLCGAEHWTEIEDFGHANLDWLRTFLDLENGVPSHDTLGRVFAALSPDEFERAFRAWTEAVAGSSAGCHIVIDGKTLRRSFDAAKGAAAIHMVSAWATDTGVSFGQMKVDGKSNEIAAIPELLRSLALPGATVTIDAMGCQREIAGTIVEKGGDYALCLKTNQPALHEDVTLWLDDAIARKEEGLDRWQTVEKGHGRVEKRTTWASADVGWLCQRHGWPGLAGVAAVESVVKEKGETRTEKRYWIGSFAGAERFGRTARAHWAVENGLHWQLDVSFGEDGCRARVANAAENFSRLRRLALQMLKNETSCKLGVKSRRKKAGWDRSYLLKVLGPGLMR